MADPRSVNHYWRQLPRLAVKLNRHRSFVGGLWDEVGELQSDFMISKGLTPDSTLLDVGCGALRGGVHFARYLADGNYHGIDINRSLLEAGIYELRKAGLDNDAVHLHCTDDFDATSFGIKFDFGISVSLITHLSANQIIYCFAQMRRVMHEHSRFYFTFFEVPNIVIPDSFQQPRGGVTTHFMSDPFHYTHEQIEFCARSAGLHPTIVGDWGHPRNQQMLELRPSDQCPH